MYDIMKKDGMGREMVIYFTIITKRPPICNCREGEK